MSSKYPAAISIAISLLCLLSLLAASLTSYAPSVSAAAMQNIYISRIFWLGGASLLFQVLALVAVVRLTVSQR